MSVVIPGSRLSPRILQTADGVAHAMPNERKVTHLLFARYAGSAQGRLHAQSFLRRQGDLRAAGVQTVVVLPTLPAHLVEQVPAATVLPVIADHDGRLSREFGMVSGWLAVLHPAAWWPEVRGLLRFGLGLPPKARDLLRLPAEFLIDRDGVVRHVHIGRHAADRWSVDQVLELVADFPVALAS
jgi:hypothetical protein